MDYAGPFEGHYLLILIDAHSKWIEAYPAKSPSSSVTIELLCTVFAQFGLPETVVSDNGTCFVSEEFRQFLKTNGIRQVTSAPYHPSSNDLAERAVQIVKKGLKKITVGSIKSRIAKFLFAYHNTPHCTTGNSPPKLLLGRNFRTRLDLLKPNIAERVENKQWDQKISHDNAAKSQPFMKGQSVLVRVYGQTRKWARGTILKSTGPVSYVVKLANGTTWRRHQDQLKSCLEQIASSPDQLLGTVPPDLLMAPSSVPISSEHTNLRTVPPRRYPQRTRRPPTKYSTYLYVNT